MNASEQTLPLRVRNVGGILNIYDERRVCHATGSGTGQGHRPKQKSAA